MKVEFEIPTLETQRLRLRGLAETDLDGFASIYSDAENARFIGGVVSRHECWRKIALMIGHWHIRGWGIFALESKANGQFIGYCGPWRPDSWQHDEIAYSLVPGQSGKGLAAEAARRAIRFAYESCGWAGAVSYVDAGNEASRRVAQKNGARRDGSATILDDETVEVWRYPSPRQFSALFPSWGSA
ncbi:MAG: GNAT family N-acetyltransferase [Pseudomonadota bacterium]